MAGAALRGYGRDYMAKGGTAAWQRKEGKSPSGGLNKKEEQVIKLKQEAL